MNHQVSILEYKKVSDGQFAVAVQCCGDVQHTSWLTVDASLVLDAERFNATLDDHCARVARDHHAAIRAKDTLHQLVGTARPHTTGA